MKEFDRRSFLKLATAGGIGVIGGEAGFFTALEVAAQTERFTGHPAGNAGNPSGTTEEYPSQPGEIIDLLFQAPVIEESAFRAMPSLVLSSLEKEDAVDNFLYGNEDYKVTRRELIVGGLSSLIFAGAHNLTPKGYNTEYIPSPQFTSGAIFWYLHRRYGMAANLVAHSTLNGLFVTGRSIWGRNNLK